MRDSPRPRLRVGALTLLASAGLYLAVPGQPQASTSSCSGSNSGKVCWQNESCVDISFYRQCTIIYKYLPAAGGGGYSRSASEVEPAGDGGSCVWGRDYIGWEPRRCQ